MNMPGRKYSVGSGYRYGFNGKELDNSTGEGNLDFGARIMDVRLGRWLSTDPKTSKYPGWSPYNFAINNPINVIDPDGEDIIFIVRNNDGSVKEQLKYMKGNFWHSNGTRYNPQNESLSPTMFKVLTAYRQIEKSNDKILKGQLHHLEDSKFKHYLQELPAGQGSSVERFNSKVRSAAEIAEGSGTNTGFDFSKEASTHFEKSEGVKNSDLSVVAHEMRHQYDSDIANQKDNSDNNNETDPAEIRAVSNENRARKLENLPLRKTYGGRKIDPKKLANPPNNLQPKTPKSK
jgi:RHS repeat-associated protein